MHMRSMLMTMVVCSSIVCFQFVGESAQLDESTAKAEKPQAETKVVPEAKKAPDYPATERKLADERKARAAAKKRGELTFDDLKFEMEKGAEFKPSMLTEANKEIDQKVWKLRGFILPSTLFSRTGIKEFVLVRDNQECCFGPGAALYDCVMVTMAPGKTVDYATRIVTVKGKLEIDTESFQYEDDGGHYAVYKMTAEEVK